MKSKRCLSHKDNDNSTKLESDQHLIGIKKVQRQKTQHKSELI
jgi:hypothetical protein